MSNKLTIITLTILLTTSCKKLDTLEKNIVGTWTMEKVYEYDSDMTDKHNPNNDRWIEFKSDHTFISDGKPFGKNAGRWTTDDEKSILYIDSDVDDDDSEWKVTFDKDLVIWTGIGHPRKENTKLIHRRKN